MEHTISHKERVEQAAGDRTFFGFWIYIMSDCLLFASLFATFAVLRNSTFGGPSGEELFNLPFVLAETIILLVSSFTAGLAIISIQRENKNYVLLWLSVTLLLGVAFLCLEIGEFNTLIAEGAGFRRSAFLSSFFTLVGTHGLHVFFGTLWMIILMIQTALMGLTGAVTRRLTLLALFWHFLDIVWIFIFTVVYLMSFIV